MLRLPVPHCPLGTGLPRGRGSFKLPKREARCPHPRREGLGTWWRGRTRTFLHLGKAGGKTAHRNAYTWAHAKARLGSTVCTHEHGPAHLPQSTDAHPDAQACRDPPPICTDVCTCMQAFTWKETDAPAQPGTHTWVNQEVEEESQASPGSHRSTAQQAWLRKDHTGPGRCTTSSSCPSAPPLLPSWNAGMGQVHRVSGLQKAKDPGWDTHGNRTSSCVPPGSGSVAA